MSHSTLTAGMAPELRVPHWIDGEGRSRAALTLAELGTGYKVLYCFQHWCAGCHESGFPALVQLVQALSPRGVGFAVVQTVFEGAEENTPERLRETQERYRLRIPFGHDGGLDGMPTVMHDYRTQGTPWFIVIDPAGRVIHSDFRIDVERAIELLGAVVPAASPDSGTAPLRWATVLEWARHGDIAPPRRVEKSDDEWRALLTPDQFRVTRLHGTEQQFSSDLCSLFEPGLYQCACCDTLLFDATTKFDSGSGWPSFTAPLTPGVVAHVLDDSHGMERVEATCHVCDAHLGHVFPDGPPPTGLRYCINALSLKKAPSES